MFVIVSNLLLLIGVTCSTHMRYSNLIQQVFENLPQHYIKLCFYNRALCLKQTIKYAYSNVKRTSSFLLGWNFVFCCFIAEAQALTLVMYSAKNIKYPKVIKLQFARPLD